MDIMNVFETKINKVQLHKEAGANVAAIMATTPKNFATKVYSLLDAVKATMNEKEKFKSLHEFCFTTIAAEAIKMAQHLGDTRSASEICDELNQVYIRKNHDYGDSFGLGFKEYGLVMACIRIEDKLRRFETLAVEKAEAKVMDEKITDTLIDLANYAILTIMEL